ncbi:MAG: 4Fe-4S dicluster domain-containing protein [Actinomycetota bacterium]|nr:4Fe-4S dicluster domain-containing protein [Actinomycetota bacterium]MDI7252533.1 4Fe-4S dicluster domain-containing protein [Actinomycetota bacterium]
MRRMRLARREFLAWGLAGAATALTYGLWPGKADAAPLLRPPGAQDEEDFVSRCLRCQECVRACMTGCLEPAGSEYGAAVMWTPRFNPALAKCEFELCGRACARACPVGAIRRPADDEVCLGTARVDRGKCIAWAEGKACLVCHERCSYGAIEPDSRGRPRVVKKRCTGCGACQNTCVTCPDPAIVVYPPEKGVRS